jgi:thymidylate kinase
MIYIFEGMDNCLKDTLIQLFRSSLPPQTQILKYNSPPRGLSNVELWQKAHFEDMFELLKTSLNSSPRNLILNRAHLGEYVYSPLYRGYEGDWIFELEKSFFGGSDIYQPRIKLFVFYDSENSRLRMREDGKSFSDNDFENMNKERDRFLKAFEESMILHKKLFNLSDYLGDFKDEPSRINVEVILSLLQEV